MAGSGSSLRSGMRGQRPRRAMSDINVVPYIDVMLVLLVIFMVTAPLVAPTVINLPTVGNTAPQQQTPPVIVNIRPDSTMTVRYKDDDGASQELPMTQPDLNSFLAQRALDHPDQPVVIAADKNVKYDTVVTVMAALKSEGVKRVGLLVRPQ